MEVSRSGRGFHPGQGWRGREGVAGRVRCCRYGCGLGLGCRFLNGLRLGLGCRFLNGLRLGFGCRFLNGLRLGFGCRLLNGLRLGFGCRLLNGLGLGLEGLGGNGFGGRCGHGRGEMLDRDGRRPGLELGAAGQTPPERDDLLGHRLAAPRGVQELLGQRPQVDGVGLAPRQRVARQRQRGADRKQAVGSHGGDPGAGRVERSELLPPRGRLQELRRDAAQRVLGPGEVVGPHRNDHGRLVGVLAPGLADDLAVGDGVLGRRLGRRRHSARLVVRGHGVRLPQRVRGPVVGQRVVVGPGIVGGHDDPRVVVGERLFEDGGALAVPGILGLAAVVGHTDAGPAGRLVGGALVALPAQAPPTHALHHDPDGRDPDQQDNRRGDVDHPPGRECPVGDAGAGLGPLRRRGQLGPAEQVDGRPRPGDHHEKGERKPEGRRGRAPQRDTPSRGGA